MQQLASGRLDLIGLTLLLVALQSHPMLDLLITHLIDLRLNTGAISHMWT